MKVCISENPQVTEQEFALILKSISKFVALLGKSTICIIPVVGIDKPEAISTPSAFTAIPKLKPCAEFVLVK